jgi:hypothetical protein
MKLLPSNQFSSTEAAQRSTSPNRSCLMRDKSRRCLRRERAGQFHRYYPHVKTLEDALLELAQSAIRPGLLAQDNNSWCQQEKDFVRVGKR